jgi:hypothetical protein
MKLGSAISSPCPSASSLCIVALVRRAPDATDLGWPSRLVATASSSWPPSRRGSSQLRRLGSSQARRSGSSRGRRRGIWRAPWPPRIAPPCSLTQVAHARRARPSRRCRTRPCLHPRLDCRAALFARPLRPLALMPVASPARRTRAAPLSTTDVGCATLAAEAATKIECRLRSNHRS